MRAQARLGRRRARLQAARQLAVGRDERNVHRQARDGGDPHEHIDIARDEWTLRDDA